MENSNKTVLGVFAPSARPDWRGFVVLGLILAVPVSLALFGVEVAIRWVF